MAIQIWINDNFKSCFKHIHFLELEFWNWVYICNWCESVKQLGMLMSGVCCILFLGRCSTSFAHQVFDSFQSDLDPCSSWPGRPLSCRVALPSSLSLHCPSLGSMQLILLYYRLSLVKVRYGWLCLFTSLIHSHCLIAAWLLYSFIHFRARQVTEVGTGELTPWVKGTATAQLSQIFAMTEYRLGLSNLFFFSFFKIKFRNLDIYVQSPVFKRWKWIHTL